MQETEEKNAAQAAGAEEQPQAEPQETEEQKLLAEVEQLRAQVAAQKAAEKEKDDRFLRMAAEYDNFRRRSREEREGVYDDALADTVKDLLPIMDDLERAAGYDDGEKVKEGLQMTLKTMANALEKLGVTSFGEAGETFDPNLHNAVLHEEDEARGEGEITEVYQRGYRKGKKIIRFAMVKTVN